MVIGGYACYLDAWLYLVMGRLYLHGYAWLYLVIGGYAWLYLVMPGYA